MWKQFFIAKYNNNSTIFSENSQSFFALQVKESDNLRPLASATQTHDQRRQCRIKRYMF